MTVIRIFPFDDPADYDFDANKVEIVNGTARLKMITTEYSVENDFDDDSGVIYESTLEVADSKLRQIDMTPEGILLSATYDFNEDADFGSGNLTGTKYGTVHIQGGLAYLTNDDISYIDYYPAALPISSGTIRVGYIPNYSGYPPHNMLPIHTGLDGPAYNQLTFAHMSDGTFYFVIRDNRGVDMYYNERTTTKYSLQSGILYDIQFTFDDSMFYGYLNGTPITSGAKKSSYVRDSNQTLVRIGTNRIKNTPSNFMVDYFQVYDGVHKHDSMEYLYKYRVGSGSYTFEFNKAAGLSDFTSVDNNARFILNDMYYDGNGWVVSDGTYSKSNISSVVKNHITDFPLSGDTLELDMLFNEHNFAAGYVDSVTVSYFSGHYCTDAPAVSNKHGVPFEGFYEFGHNAFIPSGTDVKYSLYLDSGCYWWDGSGWALSNCTYEQASSVEEINEHIDEVSGMRGNGRFYMFLYSDGQETPVVYDVSARYDYRGPDYGELDLCTVNGFITDVTDSRRSDVYVRVNVASITPVSGVNAIVPDITKETRCDPAGYWEFDLIPSEKIYNTPYEFRFIYPDGTERKYTGIYVPTSGYVNFNDII